jgi:hypothetical protein
VTRMNKTWMSRAWMSKASWPTATLRHLPVHACWRTTPPRSRPSLGNTLDETSTTTCTGWDPTNRSAPPDPDELKQIDPTKGGRGLFALLISPQAYLF